MFAVRAHAARVLTLATSVGLVSLSAIPVADADDLSLRVISFNVWGVPVVSPARPERITEIAHRLAALEPDVVALQEVWEDDDAERLGPVLASAGLTEQRRFGPNEVGGRGSGLWMASRYPIVNQRFVRFAIGHKPYIHWHLDYLSEKGVSLVEIDTPSGRVTVADTHFQSMYTLGDYTFIQLTQALTIADAAATVSTPIILAGDINATPDSIVSEVLMSKLGAAPAAANFGIDIIAARSSASQRLVVKKLEHLFEEQVVMHNGVKRTLSDHPCLLADYTLTPCVDCSAPVPPLGWADTRPKLLRFVDDNQADTHLLITLTRALMVALLLVAGLGLRILRQRPGGSRRHVGGMVTIALLCILAGWSGYASWSYGPYKLDVLQKLRKLAG